MKKVGWGIVLLITILLLCCPFVLGGNCSKQTVLLNAVGNDFEVRRDLRTQDLNVKVDGKKTQVVSLSLDSSPRRVILLVDTSDSMHVSERRSDWGIALRTAAFALDSVPSSASVALLTFSDRLHQETDGFRDRSEVANKVLTLAKQKPEGHTALLDSISEALSLFQRPQLGDAIFLVTDGADTKSKTPIRELREALIARGVRIFLFLVPIEGYVPTGEEEAQVLTEDLTADSGGYLIRIPWNEIGTDKQRTASAVAQISSQVQTVYQVEVDVSGVADLKRRVKLNLTLQKHGTETLVYSRQLATCPSAP